MRRVNSLFKNTVLFSVSTVATKLIGILMVPLYTYVFTTSQFGVIEILITLINLFSPIFMFSINDAVLRFSVGNVEQRPVIFSYGLIMGVFGSVVSLLFFPLLKVIGDVDIYFYSVFFAMLMTSLYRIVSYFAMGTDNNRSYVVSNLFVAISFATLNVLFLAVLKFNISGYLFAFVISNTLGVVILFISVDGYKFLTPAVFEKKNHRLLKDMVVYSFPLITNSLMWWTTNASDRFIVFSLMGASATGIYAVANKIPSILSSTLGIFTQAWQLSAINEFHADDRKKYYTDVYLRLTGTVLVFCSVLMASLKMVLRITVADKYYSAWQSAHFLVLAAGLSVIAAFLGANYIAAKQNVGNMLSTSIGAAANVILNFLLIPVLGLRGAAFSTFVSYLLVVIYRLYDTRKFVEIDWIDMKTIISFVLILVQIALVEVDCTVTDVVNFLVFVIVLTLNKFLVNEVFKLAKSKLCKVYAI